MPPRPALIVTVCITCSNAACCVTGPNIVTVDCDAVPVYEPDPVPVQSTNRYPAPGTASIVTTLDSGRNAVAGVAVPPESAVTVSR